LTMANWQLGNKHGALKNWVRAIQWMDKAEPELKQNKNHDYKELRNLRAEAEGLLGEFRDPEIAYREILRVEPEFAWAHYRQAESFFRSGEWSKSAAAYITALDQQDPSDLDTWLRCACTLVQARESEAYRQLCERMLKRF